MGDKNTDINEKNVSVGFIPVGFDSSETQSLIGEKGFHPVNSDEIKVPTESAFTNTTPSPLASQVIPVTTTSGDEIEPYGYPINHARVPETSGDEAAAAVRDYMNNEYPKY